MKIKDYKILNYTNSVELEKRVLELLNKGYELLGSPFISELENIGGFISQALILNESEYDKNMSGAI